jgi:hypothetical protein
MKPTSSHDRFSDPDPALDELFRVREMAPGDFAARTLAAARVRRRQARIVRFTAWSGGLAACLALVLGLALLRPAAEHGGMAVGPAETPAVAKTQDPDRAPTSADELTAALYASFSTDDVVFYAQARALEALLADAISLSDEENHMTLDFLLLLAQN